MSEANEHRGKIYTFTRGWIDWHVIEHDLHQGDEIAYLPTDESATPDKEILNALRAGMATVPGSLLICISSPYARRGTLRSIQEPLRKR